jgi:hypothetical protein
MEERQTMKGWGQRLSAEDVPQTLAEAQTTALIVCSDRLLAIATALENLQDRMARIEIWLADTSPSYARSQQQTRRKQDLIRALPGGVKIT